MYHITANHAILQFAATMEQIMQMQDDIHKLKKLMDSVFEKM